MMTSDALLRGLSKSRAPLILTAAALRDRLALWKELWRQEMEADARIRAQEERRGLAALNAASELR